jgi:excisionase family DNA binding protein
MSIEKQRLRKVFLCVKLVSMSQTLTTKDAADRLGVTPARVRQMILSGQLPAEKFGRDLVIKEEDLRLVQNRPIGRPPDTKAQTIAKATAKSGGKR